MAFQSVETRAADEMVSKAQEALQAAKEKAREIKYQAWKAAREREQQENQQVFEALCQEYGVVNHPKAQKVWDMAWERGHSSGYDSVRSEFEELVELILP